ncbi:hypothetical protein ACFV9C_29770 [Kribbella sp. NPDC059898]|uniref:hypothetical protein n=1 Tax=Kribbella sp. NPDC059898 TaxID=3346995 RepID=UPI00365D9D85
MKGVGDYRNITATVRTPRCAILINENSKHWRFAAKTAIAHFSEVWGGRYFLLIPTDGVRVKEKFWELLEAYSPDYIGQYRPTFADLEEAEPDRYAEVKERNREQFDRDDISGDFEKFFRERADSSDIEELHISDQLQKELINRLSPFHLSGRAVQHYLSRRDGFAFPFTKMPAILPFAHRQVQRITLPPAIDDPVGALMTHTRTGAATEAYLDQLRSHGIAAEAPPSECDAWQFVQYALGGRGGWATVVGNGTWEPDADYDKTTPFAISSLHLARYYRTDKQMTYLEPVVVVLGDTVDDFCFYYSLSRLHDDVYWLPLSWLSEAYRGLMASRRRRTAGEEVDEPTNQQRLARFIVNQLPQKIDYGHHDKRIELRSMSLSLAQLRARKRQVVGLSYLGVDQGLSSIICKDISETATACIGSAMEENNYAAFESAVFIDGESVSPVDTPKPKNFSKINVPEHYWLTSLVVEDYMPPPLPYLGSETLKLRGLTPELRVANDGLVYQCPNMAYFGGDADVVTVRPKLVLLDEMTILGKYFGDAGITIKYSDKGNYFLDTIRRFGSLREAGEFIRAKSTRSILDGYMAKVNEADGTVIYLDADQRAYLNFGAFQRYIGDEAAAAVLIDSLVGREVLERGLILRCERCRLSSWYSLNFLTAEFSCNRCGLTQQFTRSHWKNPSEPHWYYKLVETIYQCYENNSHVTIQVLYKLLQESTHAFHFAPELDLFGFPQGKKSEIDISCVLDGQIILGECKTEPLRPTHVKKYAQLASALSRRPDRIVFATTAESISSEFMESISGLRGSEALAFSDLFDA